MEQAKDGWDYVVQPFETIFLVRSEEIGRLVSLCSIAIGNMDGITRLTKVLRHPDERVNEAQRLEDLAMAEVRTDFPVLHSAGTVLIWGVLEAAIRDFVIRWFVKRPIDLQILEIARIRVQVGQYELLRAEDRMRYLVNILERDLGAAVKPGPGRFECLLHPLDIVPTISEEQRRDLVELAAIRNVIVHRAGMTDSRLLEICPWVALKEREPVAISGDDFRRYATAAGHYAAAVVESGETIFRERSS
jgi:hypothetical protein